MPPIDNAVTKYGSAAVQPRARKTRHVISKVATVIPDIGFDDEPTSPVSRDETVTNKNPNTMIRIAPKNETKGCAKTLNPNCGNSMIAAINARAPTTTCLLYTSPSPRDS